MGALAHYIEDEGVATTGISLVRDNTERLQPPRFLWVPFELGRPFGAPDDAPLQTRVLRAALALFERLDGPPILQDFPHDAPSDPASELSGWSCPIPLPPAQATDESTLLAAVLGEIATLAPWHTLARETRGRSGLGAARMEIAECARFLHALLLGDGNADNPSATLSLGQSLRGAAEDMKTFYMEAATAKPGQVASRELADWFWGETAAGELLLALHAVCVASADSGVQQVAKGQLVPRAQAHRLQGNASAGRAPSQ